MRLRVIRLVRPAILAVAVLAGRLPVAADPPQPPVDFNREVRPILAEHCFPCHGPDEQHRKRGLRLDLRAAAVAARKHGVAVVPGDPARSLLIRRITDSDPDQRMPPAEHGPALTAAQIDVLRRWIAEGAVYEQHWAFVPPRRVPLPAVEHAGWSRNPIDRFVLARLERAGLEPSPEADRATLLRRVSLDLTGLPPALAEVDAFEADTSPGAYEVVVDRLLASPAFGERWASVWLDLARYADSTGYASDQLRSIWRYRDWVIDAFNQDLPYDEFTIDQLAGDLLPHPTGDQLLATAFHRNTLTNTEGGTDDEEFRVEAVKDRTMTTMQVWNGLTVGCARCHSHKFDPISQVEFYRLFAFFNQTEDTDRADEKPRVPTPTPEQRPEYERRRQRVAHLRDELSRREAQQLAAWRAGAAERARHWNVLWPAHAVVGDGPGPVADAGGALALGSASLEPVELRCETVVAQPRVAALRVEMAGAAELELGVSAAPLSPHCVRGRYVRIENPGSERILSLAEVRVLAGGCDVARSGVARQSSTAHGGVAARAIDGDTDGDYFAGKSVTHTATERDPWWEVDLGAMAPIERIEVHNRTDHALQQRLSGFRIVVLDGARREVWRAFRAEPPKPCYAVTPGRDAVGVELARAEAATDGQAVFALPAPLEWAHRGGSGLRLFWRLRGRLAAAPLRLAATDAAVQPPSPPVELETELAEAEKALAALHVPTTPILRELPPGRQRRTHVLVKGNFLVPAAEVEPGVPAVIGPLGGPPPRDRLQLARWLMDPAHPLTARVAVNRFWARLFGRGLVETEEDFGTQGKPPSHPQLLDWLALSYRDGGWRVKRLLKTIVMSATYRQSSRVLPVHLQRDPRNVLLARAPRPRLPAEMVRDQALFVSGLLSRKMHGPSVFPPQPAGLWQAAFNGDRHWPTSHGEDRYRRGLYTFLRRTVTYPSLAAFDMPSREVCALRRVTTNTPLQALATLNDPAYVEAAQALARRLLREAGPDPASRAAHGLRLCLARQPEPRQVDVLVDLYRRRLSDYRADPAAARAFATDPLGPLPGGVDAAECAAWTAVANVLLNMDAMLVRS